MVYEDGILVNGPVVMSTTLTFAALGISILGVLLQVLAGILLLRGGGYQIALLIPAFRFVFAI